MILLFVGLAFIGVSSLPQTRTETVVEAREGGVWEISGPFKKGDRLTVEYRADTSWYGPNFDFVDEFGKMALKIVLVNVTNPIGGSTIFSVYLSPMGQPGQQPQPYDPLAAVKIWVEPGMPNDGLVVPSNVSLDEIKGIVKYDGTHKVQVLEPYPEPLPTKDNPTPVYKPPVYLGLRRMYEAYPTTYLFPIGGGVTVIGAVFSAWGMKTPKHRVRSHKTKG